MKIRWLGHSAFLLVSSNNVRIIIDPYNTGNGINYSPVNETADIVAISHDHSDHNNLLAVKGNPVLVREKGRHFMKDIEIKAVPVHHDGTLGSQRGNNLVFCFKMDNMLVCHAGDLGHTLSPRLISEIGPVDILMLPVGGYYTIDAAEADTVAQSLKPFIVIPMHYKTPETEYPITGVLPFLKLRKNVRQVDSSEIDIARQQLPSVCETIVLKSAH